MKWLTRVGTYHHHNQVCSPKFLKMKIVACVNKSLKTIFNDAGIFKMQYDIIATFHLGFGDSRKEHRSVSSTAGSDNVQLATSSEQAQSTAVHAQGHSSSKYQGSVVASTDANAGGNVKNPGDGKNIQITKQHCRKSHPNAVCKPSRFDVNVLRGKLPNLSSSQGNIKSTFEIKLGILILFILNFSLQIFQGSRRLQQCVHIRFLTVWYVCLSAVTERRGCSWRNVWIVCISTSFCTKSSSPRHKVKSM